MSAEKLSEDSEKRTEKRENTAIKFVSILRYSLVVTIMLFAVSLVVDVWSELKRQENRGDLITLLEGMNSLLEAVDKQTSPEAIAQRDARFGQILFMADCNTRKALEDYAKAQGLDIRIVGGECPGD